MEVIVGTAGHIDHGKTSLIKALTGVDTDRLPEEKQRGITVDLGFADLTLGELHIGFVDVPGHERFVKNMLAGASGIDVVVLIVAADEGVMPQTREHFDICRLLGIQTGVVVITKSDMVDDETIDLAKLDVAELVEGSFLENAPVVVASSRTGKGIDEVKEALAEAAARLNERTDELIFRLAVDRSFVLKGFGTVVTGTLASGKLNEGDEIELLPSDVKLRVRGLQTHGKGVKSASAGQRVAVNIAGVDHDEVERGMCLVESNVLSPVQIFDARVEVLANSPRPLRTRQRVRVHIGTAEVLGRVQVLNEEGLIAPGGNDLVQIRLEADVAAVPGERFIIRRYSPAATIAGGAVLDIAATKHRRSDLDRTRAFLTAMVESADDLEKRICLMVRAAGAKGITISEIRGRTGLRTDVLLNALAANVKLGTIQVAEDRYIDRAAFETLLGSAERAIDEFHKREPLSKGIPREALRDRVFSHLPGEIFDGAIRRLVDSGKVALDNEVVRASSHAASLSEPESRLLDAVIRKLRLAGLEPPKIDEVIAQAVIDSGAADVDARKVIRLMVDRGEIVKVTDDMYFLRTAIDELKDKLQNVVNGRQDRVIDVPEFKTIAGVSRKFAIPLIEYFDRERVTVRRGDKRIVL